MIQEIITTYLLTVNGQAMLQVNPTLSCTCIKHSRSLNCDISNGVITNDDFHRIVTVTGANGEPATDRVTIVCHEDMQ